MPELDLTRTCHVCGKPLTRDMENLTEKCTHFACSIRGINFSIMLKEDPKVEKDM